MAFLGEGCFCQRRMLLTRHCRAILVARSRSDRPQPPKPRHRPPTCLTSVFLLSQTPQFYRRTPSPSTQRRSCKQRLVALSHRRPAAMARTTKGWARGVVAFAAVALAVAAGRQYGWDGEPALAAFRRGKGALGPWAAPAYVAVHALTLALCPPYAIFFEGAAALVFGFLPGVACVFSAKILGASLSFWIGRAIFNYFTSAMEWLQRNKYFHVVVKGVEKDGWKFVLLARFSPLPSYIINYALSATDVGFFRDFLLPTIVGCLPMILQNVSIVSLAGAAVASTTGSKKSHIYSYLFPILGIVSSILISWRIKQYSSALVIPQELKDQPANGKVGDDAKLGPVQSKDTTSEKTRKRR